MPRILRRLLPLSALLLLPFLSAPAPACPFCSMQGQTMAGEVAGADMVLFGSLTNANDTAQTTDLVLDAVVKKNAVLDDLAKTVGGKKSVTLPKYLPPEVAGTNKFLVFCNIISKKEIDPYRGLAVPPGSDMVGYLKGVQEQKDKKPGERLKFFFNYLDNSDPEIAMDAFKEFANAPYSDYREMAKDLPADKIAGWLRDPNTPGFRIGLYGSLLGHCGKEEARQAAAVAGRRPRPQAEQRPGRRAGRLHHDRPQGRLGIHQGADEGHGQGVPDPLFRPAGDPFPPRLPGGAGQAGRAGRGRGPAAESERHRRPGHRRPAQVGLLRHDGPRPGAADLGRVPDHPGRAPIRAAVRAELPGRGRRPGLRDGATQGGPAGRRRRGGAAQAGAGEVDGSLLFRGTHDASPDAARLDRAGPAGVGPLPRPGVQPVRRPPPAGADAAAGGGAAGRPHDPVRHAGEPAQLHDDAAGHRRRAALRPGDHRQEAARPGPLPAGQRPQEAAVLPRLLRRQQRQDRSVSRRADRRRGGPRLRQEGAGARPERRGRQPGFLLSIPG